MKIIEPKVELIEQKDIVSHVARCARICYKRETGNDKALYDNLIKRNHLSMFRHITYYYFIPHNCAPRWISSIFNVKELNIKPIGCDIDYHNGYFFFVINGQFYIEHPNLIRDINKYEIPAIDFSNANEIAWNMMRYTFKVVTQISTSRELNRVSPNNIAEQSTRYVYEDGIICKPHWLEGYNIYQELHGAYHVYKNGKEDDDINHKVVSYIKQCDSAFNTYRYLVDAGLHRQDARGVLPLDTATSVVYTYNWSQWKHIIELRADEKHAHPNAVIIANAIKRELEQLGYDF